METYEDKMEASKAKGRALLASAREVGWDLKEFRELKKQERFELDLWNPETGEIVLVAWEAGVWQHPAYYEYQGRQVRLKNASATRKRMLQPPDVVAPRRGRTTDGLPASEGQGRIIAKSVPFDPEDTNIEELRRLLGGKTLVWLNSMDERIVEQASVRAERWIAGRDGRPPKTIPAGGKQFRLTNGEAGRSILHFASKEAGFRAVALEKILQVK